MHWTYKGRQKLRKTVHAVLILAVLISLFAPLATAHEYQRKEEAINVKINDLIGQEDNYSLEDKRAQLLVKILKLMPQEHWAPLDNIKIEDKVRTPRGFKDQDSVVMNYGKIDSDEEFIAVFLHELGHVVDLDVFVGESDEPSNFVFLDRSPVPSDDPSVEFYQITWDNTRSPHDTAQHLDAVSEYGFTNPFEDYAEAYIFYLLHGKSFKLLTDKNESLKEKYIFLKNKTFNGMEFAFGDVFYDNEEIYDTTVLFFDLDAFITMMEAEKGKKQTISRSSSSKPPRYSRG